MVLTAVKVEGLADFNRALRQADVDSAKALNRAGREAMNIIVSQAHLNASTPLERRIANTLKTFSVQKGAGVKIGDSSHPEALGAEFGSKKYRQFKPWRGNQWQGWDGGPGYVLHPAIRQKANEAIDVYWHNLEVLLHSAFPEGTIG